MGRGGRGRGRSYDEAVILTLSSDEYDELNTTNSREVSSNICTPALAEQFILKVSTVNKKEPIIPPKFDEGIGSNDITLYYIAKSNVHLSLPS